MGEIVKDLQKFEVTFHAPKATHTRYVLASEHSRVNAWADQIATLLTYNGWEILGEEEFKERSEEGDDSIEFNWPEDIETLEDGRMALIIPVITEEYIAQQQSSERQRKLEERQSAKDAA